MVPKVLIVDDDQSWLSLMHKELGSYSRDFAIRTADSGDSALAILKQEHIVVVVSDLRMPGIDGFDLLSRILANYPDIPVIIVTAYDRPKTKDVVFRSGAAGYLTKPFSPDILAGEINKILRKKVAGGNLHNVSLETFLQLVEMEQQTCTLHVLNKTNKLGGVLFFRNGDIVNARIAGRQGKAAAYEILSWSSVSVSIENDCVFEEKLIEGDLQAILLDAMRSKDENEEASQALADGNEIVLDEPVSGEEPVNPGDVKAEAIEAQADVEGAQNPPPVVEETEPEEELSAVESIRRQLAAALGNHSGINDIYTDDDWDQIIIQASNLGEIFDLGQLNVLYASKGSEGQYLVLPEDDETTVISIDPDAPRDRIIGVLS